MAAPAGPLQPMYFGDLLPHPMAGPREQAGQHVDFARDNYYTTTEHALQQQAQEYEGAPEDDFLESQEVSISKNAEQALLPGRLRSAWGNTWSCASQDSLFRLD